MTLLGLFPGSTLRRRPPWRRPRSLSAPAPDPDQWFASLIAGPALPTPGLDQEQNGHGPAQGLNEEKGPAPIPLGESNGKNVSRPSPAGWLGRHRRGVAAIVVLALVGGGLAWGAVSVLAERAEARRELSAAQAKLAQAGRTVTSISAERDDLRSQLAAAEAHASEVEAKLATAGAEMERLRSLEGQEFAPNGSGITVETTGYTDLLEIRDVQLTRAYGFSDLIGIAVNTSGRDLEYVEIGCSLLDAGGRVVANVIDNREVWPAGATWGFDCSAEVEATGGVVRVDSVS